MTVVKNAATTSNEELVHVSKAQYAFLTAVLTMENVENRTDAAVAAGLKPNTVMKWFARDAEFNKAWRAIYKTQVEHNFPFIMAGQISRARVGRDTKAAELVAKIGGKVKQAGELNLTGIPDRLSLVGDLPIGELKQLVEKRSESP